MRLSFLLPLLLGLSCVSAQYNYPPQGQQNPNNNNLNNNGFYPQNPQNPQNQNNPNQNYQGFNGQNQNNNPQQRNQQYQNQIPNGQPIQRPSGFVNTAPLSSTVLDQNLQNQTGAVIQLQLQSYSNPGLKLPGGGTCAAPPSGKVCSVAPMYGPQCYFSFTTIISTPDMSVQYIATEFLPLDSQGNLDLTRATTNWTVPQTLYLSSKPSAIDVFVHHLGIVTDQQTGALVSCNNLVHVDTFVLSLKDYLPGTTSQAATTNAPVLSGTILQSSLKISYSVQCRNNFMGPNCDLTCTPSTSNSQNAVCYSNVTGFSSICTYQTGQQVSNCQPCQNGVSNGQCSGVVITTASAGSDSSSFRTWTIVLGCLFGLALIFIIALIVFIIVTRNREPAPAYRAQPPPPTNTWAKSPATRPLLSDTYPSKAEQNSQDWGYQPHVVSVNNQRSAPIADREGSRHSQSTNDDQNSHSSYANARPANGNPVALARREAQV
uniref:Uncharacterized protein n=1 Tax=Plectus sambesii TaxID=2011161 RepID=A0A914VST7_9BILA